MSGRFVLGVAAMWCILVVVDETAALLTRATLGIVAGLICLLEIWLGRREYKRDVLQGLDMRKIK